MLSRVAENLFWMARYMERTNSQLRMLRTLYVASQDSIPFMQWNEVYQMFNHNMQSDTDPSTADILCFVLFDKESEGSIFNNVFRARENARSAQDHIAIELWQCLNDFYHLVKRTDLPQRITSGDPITVFDGLIKQCMYYYGIIDSFMFRGEGFYFLNMGKYIERSQQTIKVLHYQYKSNGGFASKGLELVSWRYFLFAMSGYEFYLKSNAGAMKPEKIFYQVLKDALFPHSVAYCLQRIVYYGDKLAISRKEESSSNVNFAIGKADAALKYGTHGSNDEQVYQYFYQLNEELWHIVTALNKNYFGLNQ